MLLLIIKKCDGWTQNSRCSYVKATYTCLCYETFFDFDPDHGKECLKEANFVQILEVHNIRLKILSMKELTTTFPNLLNLTVVRGNTKKIINDAVDSNKIKVGDTVEQNCIPLTVKQFPDSPIEKLDDWKYFRCRFKILKKFTYFGFERKSFKILNIFQYPVNGFYWRYQTKR